MKSTFFLFLILLPFLYTQDESSNEGCNVNIEFPGLIHVRQRIFNAENFQLLQQRTSDHYGNFSNIPVPFTGRLTILVEHGELYRLFRDVPCRDQTTHLISDITTQLNLKFQGFDAENIRVIHDMRTIDSARNLKNEKTFTVLRGFDYDIYFKAFGSVPSFRTISADSPIVEVNFFAGVLNVHFPGIHADFVKVFHFGTNNEVASIDNPINFAAFPLLVGYYTVQIKQGGVVVSKNVITREGITNMDGLVCNIQIDTHSLNITKIMATTVNTDQTVIEIPKPNGNTTLSLLKSVYLLHINHLSITKTIPVNCSAELPTFVASEEIICRPTLNFGGITLDRLQVILADTNEIIYEDTNLLDRTKLTLFKNEVYRVIVQQGGKIGTFEFNCTCCDLQMFNLTCTLGFDIADINLNKVVISSTNNNETVIEATNVTNETRLHLLRCDNYEAELTQNEVTRKFSFHCQKEETILDNIAVLIYIIIPYDRDVSISFRAEEDDKLIWERSGMSGDTSFHILRGRYKIRVIHGEVDKEFVVSLQNEREAFLYVLGYLFPYELINN